MDLNNAAVEALESLALHENAFSSLFSSFSFSLLSLPHKAQTLAARWEKLAWFVVVTVMGSMGTLVMGMI